MAMKLSNPDSAPGLPRRGDQCPPHLLRQRVNDAPASMNEKFSAMFEAVDQLLKRTLSAYGPAQPRSLAKRCPQCAK